MIVMRLLGAVFILLWTTFPRNFGSEEAPPVFPYPERRGI